MVDEEEDKGERGRRRIKRRARGKEKRLEYTNLKRPRKLKRRIEN